MMQNGNQIVELTTREDFARAFLVMKELRTNLDTEKYFEILNTARIDSGYRLLALENQSRVIVALMGFRILADFVHGKHLYIDDLVTTKDLRSQGLGAMLLKHAETLAKQSGCVGLRLCTGIENEAGKKFYEREGWSARALAFKKKLS